MNESPAFDQCIACGDDVDWRHIDAMKTERGFLRVFWNHTCGAMGETQLTAGEWQMYAEDRDLAMKQEHEDSQIKAVQIVLKNLSPDALFHYWAEQEVNAPHTIREEDDEWRT